MLTSQVRERYYAIFTALFIYLFFLADAINKFIQVNTGLSEEGNVYQDSSSVSVYVRFLFELFCLVLIAAFARKKTINFFTLIIAFALSVLFGNLTFVILNEYSYEWGYHLKLLNKYLFVFIIYLALLPLKSSKHLALPLKAFRNIVLANSVLIVIGLLFNITYFKSYYLSVDRFGYNGVNPSLNETTLFYIIGLTYLYATRKWSKSALYIFWFVLFSTVFIGAKGVYLYNIFLFFYHVLFHVKWKYRVFIMSAFVLSFSYGLYTIVTDYSFLVEKFLYIYEEKGLLSMLLSERDMLFEKRFFENISFWNPINYIFGGYDQQKYLVEMDFVDIFLFFGIFGSIVYVLMYFNSIFLFKKWDSLVVFFVFNYFFQAALSGHFFFSAINALYLVLISFYLKERSNGLFALTRAS